MITVEVSTHGLEFDEVAEKLSKGLRQKLIEKLADIAYATAFWGAPWRTGKLAGSIVKEVAEGEASINALASYTVYVEKGTSTSTVNKRVRDLEKHGYLKKAQVTQRVGGITNYYELTPQSNLNKFLDANKASDLFTGLSRENATIILADLIKAKGDKEDRKPSIL